MPKFDPQVGTLAKSGGGCRPSYSGIFSDWLCPITAAGDDKLMAITPAMPEGSGMVAFSYQYPRQYFDVAIDRGGVMGADGQTHQGAFDLSYLRCIPNMVIMTPSAENECRLMLHTGYHYRAGASAVRYPRGNGSGAPLSELYEFLLGKGVVRHEGVGVVILNFGTLLPEAEEAAKALNATLLDMRFLKPLDGALIKELSARRQALVTVEENAILDGTSGCRCRY